LGVLHPKGKTWLKCQMAPRKGGDNQKNAKGGRDAITERENPVFH